MNYNNIAEIYNLLSESSRQDSFGDVFESIHFNGFNIQISAGDRSFSSPSRRYSQLIHYDGVQVEIREAIRDEEHSICPEQDERFKNFDWSVYFSFIDANGNHKSSYIGTVPLHTVCEVIRSIYKVSRMKMFY